MLAVVEPITDQVLEALQALVLDSRTNISVSTLVLDILIRRWELKHYSRHFYLTPAPVLSHISPLKWLPLVITYIHVLGNVIYNYALEFTPTQRHNIIGIVCPWFNHTTSWVYTTR